MSHLGKSTDRRLSDAERSVEMAWVGTDRLDSRAAPREG